MISLANAIPKNVKSYYFSDFNQYYIMSLDSRKQDVCIYEQKSACSVHAYRQNILFLICFLDSKTPS